MTVYGVLNVNIYYVVLKSFKDYCKVPFLTRGLVNISFISRSKLIGCSFAVLFTLIYFPVQF